MGIFYVCMFFFAVFVKIFVGRLVGQVLGWEILMVSASGFWCCVVGVFVCVISVYILGVMFWYFMCMIR